MRWALRKCRSVSGYLATRLGGMLANPRGQAGVVTAILAPVIIGAAALAIDAALWQVNQRSQQGAADQAAIAGMNAYVLSGDNGGVATDAIAQQAALAVAASFGYPACPQSATGCPCTSGYGVCAGLPVTVAAYDTYCAADKTQCLQVTITQPQQRFLSQVLYSGTPVATASATTYYAPGGACVLALDQNTPGGGAPPTPPPSVSLGGSSKMELNACNLVNNLNDPDATKNDTDITGSSILEATNGGQILLAQTNTYFGGGTVSPTPIYGTSPMPDPYANRKPPTITGCTFPGLNNTTKSTLPPAFDNTSTITSSTTYGAQKKVGGDTFNVVFTPTSPTTPLVFCGGLKVTSANVYLMPGIYVMDGGGFTFSGNGVLYGDQVTIYVTCDSNFENLTKNPFGGNISPKPDCSKNYGSLSITGTAGSCASGVCDVNGYCETSTTCNTSSDCSGQNKYCSQPANTFYGDTNNSTTIANLQQTPSGIAVGDGVSGPGIPSGATITAINFAANTLTISAPATTTSTAQALVDVGPGFCSKACTGSASAPKVTLTAPLATTNPPSGTAGMAIWIDKNAPVNAAATFTGDAGLNINGAIYAPTQAVTYEGGQSSTSTCSQLVSLTVNMSGGHNTTFSQAGCTPGSGVAGHGAAKLVE